MSRRAFMKRYALPAGIGMAASYLALAPEDFPLSLKDSTGMRSRPRPEIFRLRDFRVPGPAGKPPVGIGRRGSTGEKLKKALDAIGGLPHYIHKGDIVLIKPNVAFDRSPLLGANSSPEILGELVKILYRDCGAAEVRVTDNPIESPADCFAKSGIREAAEKWGGRIYLPDGNAFKILNTPGARLIENWPFFSRPFLGVTKVIGLAPVKDHNLCMASMGLKNWYGLLGGDRSQFHQDIHEVISDLSIMIRPTLTVLDGTRVLMKSGPTGGDPSYVKDNDAVVAGLDQVAMDAWAFRNLLERKGPLPDYIARAGEKGGGSADYRGRTREVS